MKGKIAHQLLDMFLDCGASVSCISKRCVAASPSLKQLQQSVYASPGLEGVNGRTLKVLYTVCAPVVIRNPAISLQVQFAVIEDLALFMHYRTGLSITIKVLGHGQSTRLFETK